MLYDHDSIKRSNEGGKKECFKMERLCQTPKMRKRGTRHHSWRTRFPIQTQTQQQKSDIIRGNAIHSKKFKAKRDVRYEQLRRRIFTISDWSASEPS